MALVRSHPTSASKNRWMMACNTLKMRQLLFNQPLSKTCRQLNLELIKEEKLSLCYLGATKGFKENPHNATIWFLIVAYWSLSPKYLFYAVLSVFLSKIRMAKVLSQPLNPIKIIRNFLQQ
jgi:hypothetical protein